MSRNETVVTVKDSTGPSPRVVRRTINRFNFLPGPKYHVNIGVPDRGECWLHDLRISYLRADSLNFIRADGMRTPWLVHYFAASTVGVPIDRQQPEEAYDYQQLHVAPWARLSFAYCDSFDYRETADVAAISPDAIKVFRYVSDLCSGVLFGESRTVAGFAGDFGAGMLGWGDLRDIIKNLAYALPGGQQPDWKVFWLAVLGLGLDIAQIFTGGAAAAPNAVVAIIKQLMVNLRRYATPEAMRTARYIGVYARKILVRTHGLQVGHAIQAGFALNDLNSLRQLLGKEFVDFFLEGLDNDLEQIVGYYQNVPFPTPPNFEVNTGFVTATASASTTATNAVQKVMKRIEIITTFFNPSVLSAPHIEDLCAFFRRARTSHNIEDEKLLKLLEGAYEPTYFNPNIKWNVNARTTEQANELLAVSMARLAKFMEDGASAKMNPSALRGLMAFAAASGPHRAMALIDNFCPAGKATPRLMEVLQDCDYARKLVQDMKPVDYRGVETAWASDTRLNSLHNLWNGLAARSPENRPYVGNVNGAIGELKALRRFGKKIQHISPESLGPTVLSRTVKLQDFLFTPTHAIEVKSVMSGKKLWGRIQDMKFQLDRWVAMNYARRAHNIAINSSELHQPIIKQLTYVIVIPQNSTGKRAKLIERELREHVETLLKDPDAWGDVDVVPDINFEVIRLDELT